MNTDSCSIADQHRQLMGGLRHFLLLCILSFEIGSKVVIFYDLESVF